MPAGLLAAHPSWIDGPTKHRPRLARPVRLPVPPGTTVRAVTKGRIVAVRTHRPTLVRPYATATVVLRGADGATYTYRGLVQPVVHRRQEVKVGRRLGATSPLGLTFAIRVPDTSHTVDTREALEAWSLQTTVDVNALPVTTSPVRQPDGVFERTSHVLVVSDAAAGRTAHDLRHHLGTRRVKVSTLSLGRQTPLRAQAAAIARAAVIHPGQLATRTTKAQPPVRANLVVIALASGTPAEARRLVADLPADQRVLWVVPPSRPAPSASAGVQGLLTAELAATRPAAHTAAYRALVGSHHSLRVETLPPELSVLTASHGLGAARTWSPVGANVISSLTAGYAATAYRLPLVNPKVATVLAYAQAQLGKPYRWAGAGPYNFDCSGLVMMAFRRVGIDFVHNALAQYEATKAERVNPANLQPGDLVFFGRTQSAIHHVGIYVGNGRMIDAPQTGQDVQVESMTGFGFYAATDPLGTGNSLPTMTPIPGVGGINQDQAFAQDLVTATWGPGQWLYLDELWNRESGWNPSATNPTSGAYGIPQALPATKMGAAGADWFTNPFTQILWGVDYIRGRYGSPQAAWRHETLFGWY